MSIPTIDVFPGARAARDRTPSPNDPAEARGATFAGPLGRAVARALATGAVAALAILAPAGTATAGVAPTGRAGAEFRFAFIGDRTGGATPGVWESIVDQIEMLRPDFVVSVGDHIEGYTEDPAELEKQWTGIDEILARLSVPFYPCPGNHDITTDGMLAAWKGHCRREPCYSFQHQGVHFVILDTSRWDTTEQWMRDSGYVDWLRADLQKHRAARLTVVVYHKPYWYNTLAAQQEDSMHQIFREYGVDYVFNGHFHTYGTGTYDGIRYTMLGSSGGAIDAMDVDRGVFFQYAWCAVRGDSLDWQLIRPESVLPERHVPVTDLKFLEEVATRYIQTEPFAPADPAQSGPVACGVSIQNVTPSEWVARLRWEPAPGWTISPDSISLPLKPDLGVTIPFQVTRVGPYYPLPRLTLDYPYREGRVYRHNQPLVTRRTQPALRLAENVAPPAIDGDLADPCWAHAVPATEFGDPSGNANVIEPTAVYFAQDVKSLYFAARCTQSDGPPLVRAVARDAAVHRDDCVGFFLCADPGARTVYQIYFNAAGTVFDQKITIEGPGQYGGEMASWNGDCTVAARQSAGEWVVEAAIPFASLDVPAPAPGDRWRVNFRRKEMSRDSAADWQYPLGYEPEQFGYLRFGD